MLKNYEGVFIISPDAEKEALEQIILSIQETITKQGGQVLQLDQWGKRPLAYRIRKQMEGQYLIARFSLDSKAVGGLEQSLKLREEILRSLIVVA